MGPHAWFTYLFATRLTSPHKSGYASPFSFNFSLFVHTPLKGNMIRCSIADFSWPYFVAGGCSCYISFDRLVLVAPTPLVFIVILYKNARQFFAFCAVLLLAFDPGVRVLPPLNIRVVCVCERFVWYTFITFLFECFVLHHHTPRSIISACLTLLDEWASLASSLF